MKKLLNNIKNEIVNLFNQFKEILTIDFILELIKKPSFIAWSLIVIVSSIFFISNGGIFRVIEILLVSIMFYFFFFKK